MDKGRGDAALFCVWCAHINYSGKFMTYKIAVLPGDGIGPEITEQAVRVLGALGLDFDLQTAPVGGAAYAQQGHPLPPSTLDLAKSSARSDEHTSELQSLMRISYAVFCLKKKTSQPQHSN